ncbi:class I SAM-dependent methyltransferase [Patiriisocius hiemis]|uniref:Class I SAM-dependent methyltransferase n=1 Tax=Patiriisocius hiemis TaxID=3075604 RepID=A0ABU2YF62_9FLAO|nr:class I SAM-dependent methyltransferase [Constantimarinum sp. W242]MDT0556823.1 class I SAM-dependent methyltransferase [Constantimarinum sp. W242]
MQKDNQHWFTSWFDTPYYHILYKDRDYNEAATFMKKLTAFLKLEPNAEILDLACGRGRHSKYLNEIGYNVLGADLSPSNILFAKQFENKTLHFKVHDMCIPMNKTFDAVFNLFTSFGYFESEEDNYRTIKAIKQQLKPHGYGVIDFLNTEYVKKTLIPEEKKVVEGITFNITKKLQNGYIVKTIQFEDHGKHYTFQEKVKALTLSDFKEYFKKASIDLKYILGSYDLSNYNEDTSQRLILIFK